MVKRAIIVVLIVAAATTGIADDRTGGRPDPVDPAVPGPAPRYESVFKEYRKVPERDQTSWERANEEVGRLGGHAGHAGSGAPAHKGDRHPISRPPASPGGEPSPAPPGHGEGHGK